MPKSYWELDILNHEIRTPLTGILGMLHRLNSGPLTAQQKDCLTDINIASAELLNAVEGFLEEGKAIISKTSREYTHDNNQPNQSTKSFVSRRQSDHSKSTAVAA
jgi:signal transduction histidine kinase